MFLKRVIYAKSRSGIMIPAMNGCESNVLFRQLSVVVGGE